MTEAAIAGTWSLKDLIAHLAWYEGEMVNVLRARAFVGSALWDLPQDERNAAIFELNEGRPLGDVRAEGQQRSAELWAELEQLTDVDLNDPARFPGMPEDWIPGAVFASNTYEHYDQHLPGVEAWLERTPGGS